MNTRALVGGIIEHWLKLGGNRLTIVFTAGVQHSVHVRDEFRAAGVVAEHIDASTKPEERKRIIAAFKSGAVSVLCNCMIFTEGFDESSASCLILARPTKLLTTYRQMCGRVLRPHPGKADALILDHAGGVFAHGYPDDDIEWILSPDKRAVNTTATARAQKGRELTDCPACHAVRVAGDGCSSCGWEPPQTKPKHLEVINGDLGEVRRDRSVHVLDQDHLRFYRELRHIERRRGYKRGWAYHKFREKFPNAAPPPWSWNDLEPLEPSRATLAWDRHRRIVWAKSRRAS
jgi:superfamily II DNA or RNA helicase